MFSGGAKEGHERNKLKRAVEELKGKVEKERKKNKYQKRSKINQLNADCGVY